MLTVPSLAAITFPSFLFKNQNLLCLALPHDFAGNFSVGHQRQTDFNLAVATDEQDIRQSYLIPNVSRKFFNPDNVPFGHTVLLSAGSNYCILHKFLDRKSTRLNSSH